MRDEPIEPGRTEHGPARLAHSPLLPALGPLTIMLSGASQAMRTDWNTVRSKEIASNYSGPRSASNLQ
jgi:hypothetical protein